MNVGIIGLGLMGGSFALALRDRYKEVEILGYDHNDQHCIEALELHLVDRISDELEDFKNLDLIVLAIPVNGIIATLPELVGVDEKTTIIDFGSTKKQIVECVPDEIRRNFVAAHPMTGTEKSGPVAAKADLYRGKVVVLCDIEESGEIQRRLAKKIFTDLGMKIFYMDAEEHDRHAAFISHMPHALSYALANAVMKQENPRAIIALAGGGFKDMSRIAKSSPNMWTDIFRQNQVNLLQAIECFKGELERCENLVKEEKWEELHHWMERANDLHKIL
ncbi:prephenate dehydrogenase [Nitratifractor salsuginis]|uniref:prephenate dehydrogenase n=1 Tax=Nitratifractor salsuginis (strain DSM 16511 / JCM 12458 / E9I37-1) TaxID=749222 RepID=E6WZH1_NITSE|nr:prephenate dehydrogenase [Nitratifractor salsuginis]ADV45551.1 prephenate dehydrogenase [Nitratifractor salsuginis DSM 16511]